MKKKQKISKYERRAVFNELAPYCHFAKNGDFIEVCEWENGEGFDITTSGTLATVHQLTWGQWELIKDLVKELNK